MMNIWKLPRAKSNFVISLIALSGLLWLAARTHAQELPKIDPNLPLTRIAFGSCTRQNLEQPIWERIVQTNPQAFLYIGDNIYGDTQDMDVLRAKYGQLAANPGYQKLKAVCPILAVWDDHDYGVNDGGVEYPMKEQSQRVFLDFFGAALDDPRRKRAGVYSAQIYGPPGQRVQIILLDTRYFRSPLKRATPPETGLVPDADAQKTMLGEAQWAWLAEQLRQPAEVRLIASGIQVIAQDHKSEKWMNLPLEQQRLFNLIRDTKANGVVMLSGDRHLAELSMRTDGTPYPLYDLTSSGLNSAAGKWRPLEINRYRVATMNWGLNFGMVKIDWKQPIPRLNLQIYDADGEITINQKVMLDTLRVP